MGTGIDLARQLDPEAAAAMENMKEQLLLVFLKRLGGKACVPVSEIDNVPRGMLLTMELDPVAREFTFELRKKQ